MIIYGNRVIAEAGNYLINSIGQRGFTLPFMEDETYTEVELELTAEKAPYNTVVIGGVFSIKQTDHIKKDLITKLWSNDDQIAIMLNRDNGPEYESVYQFMQRWRMWAGQIAHVIDELPEHYEEVDIQVEVEETSSNEELQ